jgi:hypothetical protein
MVFSCAPSRYSVKHGSPAANTARSRFSPKSLELGEGGVSHGFTSQRLKRSTTARWNSAKACARVTASKYWQVLQWTQKPNKR